MYMYKCTFISMYKSGCASMKVMEVTTKCMPCLRVALAKKLKKSYDEPILNSLKP